MLFLTSCIGGNIPLDLVTPMVSPSQPPAILTPTPPFVASTTPTLTGTFTPVGTDQTVTSTPTATEIPASISPTETISATPQPGISIEILGCNTSLDITHGLGEVTNAFPVLRNVSGTDLTNVCATLSATDEGRAHPDKTACVPILPNEYQVTLKLTVDTTFKQDTAIQVDVQSQQGATASLRVAACRDISLFGGEPGQVGIPVPIQ